MLRPSRWIWENCLLVARRCLRCITRTNWLDGETMAALEPPPLQNGPAIRGTGTRSEAVYSGTATFFWLISPFRHNLGAVRGCESMDSDLGIIWCASSHVKASCVRLRLPFGPLLFLQICCLVPRGASAVMISTSRNSTTLPPNGSG